MSEKSIDLCSLGPTQASVQRIDAYITRKEHWSTKNQNVIDLISMPTHKPHISSVRSGVASYIFPRAVLNGLPGLIRAFIGFLWPSEAPQDGSE